MKTIKHNIWTIALALTTLSLTACSNDDSVAETQQPDGIKDNIVTLTATLLPKDGTATRALADPEDGTLTSEWAVDEDLLVGYKDTNNEDAYAKGTVTSVDGSGNATITVPLTSPMEGESTIDFFYPYSSASGDVDAYFDQTGTLDDVSANYDQCQGSGTLTVSSGTPTLPTGVAMTRQNCIWKFTFTDGTNDITDQITSLEIDDGSGGGVPYTITPDGLDAIYVSLYAVEDNTITITAQTATGVYRKVKSGITLENGKLYTSSDLALTKVELGQLFGTDGNVYANAAAVTAAGTTAIGVVAYLDQADTEEDDAITEKNYGGGHGLVLCLKNATNNARWSTDYTTEEFTGESVTSAEALKRTENVSGYYNTTRLTAKANANEKYPAAYLAENYTGLAAPATCNTGWFLPSAQQWVMMMKGLGGVDKNSVTWGSWFDNNHLGVSAWNTALEKAGAGNYDNMTYEYIFFWSSSEYSSGNAVYLSIDATDIGDQNGFYFSHTGKNGSQYGVRPILAF